MSTVEQIEQMPLTKIIAGLKPIRVSLEWDGDRGFAKIEDRLVYEGEKLAVQYSADVHALGVTEKSTHDYPGSFEIIDTEIYTTGIWVRDEDGVEIPMTDAEYDMLESKIKESIIVE